MFKNKSALFCIDKQKKIQTIYYFKTNELIKTLPTNKHYFNQVVYRSKATKQQLKYVDEKYKKDDVLLIKTKLIKNKIVVWFPTSMLILMMMSADELSEMLDKFETVFDFDLYTPDKLHELIKTKKYRNQHSVTTLGNTKKYIDEKLQVQNYSTFFTYK
jgi:hypothetical protein